MIIYFCEYWSLDQKGKKDEKWQDAHMSLSPKIMNRENCNRKKATVEGYITGGIQEPQDCFKAEAAFPLKGPRTSAAINNTVQPIEIGLRSDGAWRYIQLLGH
jgi:hypothetical protein